MKRSTYKRFGSKPKALVSTSRRRGPKPSGEPRKIAPVNVIVQNGQILMPERLTINHTRPLSSAGRSTKPAERQSREDAGESQQAS